jgi:RNA polymerase sigma-70 factor (ECF subfamily)
MIRNSHEHKDSDVTTDAWSLRPARSQEAAGPKAFDALFKAHYQEIYRLLYRITGTREEAEDLAQETFLRLHKASYLWDRMQLPGEHRHPGLSAGGGTGNVRAWLYRVASNLAFNLLRGEGRRRRRQEAVARQVVVQGGQEADPAETAMRTDERTAVHRALAALPQQQAQLLLLRHAGLSYRELAEALGIALGSVGTMLARAEAAFARIYQADGSAEGGGHEV